MGRIAAIIREKPKISGGGGNGHLNSYEEAAVRHKKRSDRIKTEN